MRTKLAWAAAIAGVCGAIVAPAGFAAAESAQDTINRLQSEGYTVTIDKIGTAPIDQCTVTSVRNPQSVSQLVPYVGPGRGNDRNVLIQQTVSQTISVSLNCSR
ncbi:hypothetical protein CIW52_23590 [Mycolicibacterium sp. P9-64]|uniref:hypothetical protein n=1 Tax=Mycolicibacterium sp. P9-64 TaxID=2024612 RepID=UPI0011ECB8E2|nr:hypothetical protein [Mycolicibacterium sp. P9-64]KAA0080588.1 hypothetical protein CIW52_23590 [Mycolicibacterium sp. P9-64]